MGFTTWGSISGDREMPHGFSFIYGTDMFHYDDPESMDELLFWYRGDEELTEEYKRKYEEDKD
jgi:hypothetical protein